MEHCLSGCPLVNSRMKHNSCQCNMWRVSPRSRSVRFVVSYDCRFGDVGCKFRSCGYYYSQTCPKHAVWGPKKCLLRAGVCLVEGHLTSYLESKWSPFKKQWNYKKCFKKWTKITYSNAKTMESDQINWHSTLKCAHFACLEEEIPCWRPEILHVIRWGQVNA